MALISPRTSAIMLHLKQLSLHTLPARVTHVAKRYLVTTECRYTERLSCAQVVLDCHQTKRNHNAFIDVEEALLQYHEGIDEVARIKHDYRSLVQPDDFDKLPPKCSSCGALFQTQYDNHIGYIAAKKLQEAMRSNQLHRLKCLNCYNLMYRGKLDMPLVNRSDTFAELRHVRRKRALILYVVDMFDMEGTMMKDILKLIGRRHKVVIVGNKVDRLPLNERSPKHQMKHMKEVLKDLCLQNGLLGGNLVDVCLISAFTGYGMDTLVHNIVNFRDHNDVYIMGCANTGKSALYNFLVSALNVNSKSELPAQAIVHHVPGTTVRLVRSHIASRKWTRLHEIMKNGFPEEKPEENEKVEQRSYFDFDDEILELIDAKPRGQARKRFGILAEVEKKKDERSSSQKLIGTSSALQRKSYKLIDDNDRDEPIHRGKFLYDTPGIFNESQIIQYLTPPEINCLCPTRWIVPQTMLLKPGNCLFVGGLARMDYIDIDGSARPYPDDEEEEESEWSESAEFSRSSQGIFVTAMVSPQVPLHVTVTETADDKFQKLFSDNFLGIPVGSPDRFKQFPKLEQRRYTAVGKGKNVNACDLALHGVGWLSIAAAPNSRVHVALHTPHGEGQSLRVTSLLPYTVQQKMGKKGYRGRPSPYYYGHMRRRSPHLIALPEFQNPVIPELYVRLKEKLRVEKMLRKEAEKLELREQGFLFGRAKRMKELEDKVKLLEGENKVTLIGEKLLEGENEVTLIGEEKHPEEDDSTVELFEDDLQIKTSEGKRKKWRLRRWARNHHRRVNRR